MNWAALAARSLVRGYNLCWMRTCTALRRGKGTAFIEWGGESSFCEKVCIFIEWTPTHTHLSSWTLGAWAGLLSRSPPLRSSGRRLSSRGRARVASRASPLTLALPAGPHTFLRTSGSCRGAVAVAPAWQAWENLSAGQSHALTKIWICSCCWGRVGITWLIAFARFWVSGIARLWSPRHHRRGRREYRSV